MMKDPSRRTFLMGRWAADKPSESPAQTCPGPENQPRESALPPVISWLSNYTNEAVEVEVPRPSSTMPILRPPGAVEESLFLHRCTGCGDCVDVCPHNAIRYAPTRFREAAATPHLDPSTTPCWLCEDLPCIDACAEKALVPQTGRMGTAQISRFDCLNVLGTECSTCVERCPVDGAMTIRLAEDSPTQAPQVYEALCLGCGVCHYVCPAPNNAVLILPNARRESGEDCSAEDP